MPDTPISLYVPARNVATTLRGCIDAIREQTRPPDEIFIVVDPRSTDDTLHVARSLGVEILEQQGRSLGAARNEAIQHARHQWLASCDADVVIDPAWLEHLAASRDSGAAGIGGGTHERVLDGCDAWRAMHMPHHWGDYPFRNPFMLVSEVLFHRRALLAVGGYRDDLSYYEDSDLCQRLRDAGYDLYYQPAARATHLRHDDLAGLLNLRWKYSEYRQMHLTDSYAGLIDKMQVNREYAINTLSKTLARGREELAYISFVLFFHHVLLDLRSFLSRRPLLNRVMRLGCECELLRTLTGIVAQRRRELAACVEQDLRALMSDRAEHLCTESVPPRWPEYLRGAMRHAASFVDELGGEVRSIIEASAAVVHHRNEPTTVPRLTVSEALVESVASLPLTPCINAKWLESIRQTWPDVERFLVVGAALPEEHLVVDERPPHGVSGVAAVCAHLEAEFRPLERLTQVAKSHDRVAACYRAPASFIPGLDVVSAGDLAAAATGAGWTIDRFETLVGRTQMLLSKPGRDG